MRLSLFILLLLVTFAGGALTSRAFAQGYRELAPFSAVRFVPEVQIDGRWYLLRSIDGVPVQDIIEFAMRAENDRWARRFSEDLVALLTKMGKPPGETVALVVYDLETGEEKKLAQVPMTSANREALKKLRYELESRSRSASTPQALHGALDDFTRALDERWSYRHANGADFAAAVAALRPKIDAGISSNDFGIELQRIIARGIDGHAAVAGFTLPSGGCLPFLVEPEGTRFVAFKPDRSGFLADGLPYLTALDGKDVAEWCAAAAVLVPQGSPQYVRRHSLGLLRHLDHVRGLMKLPAQTSVRIELASADSQGRQTMSLPVARRPSTYGVWPVGGSQRLGGNVAYLRLPDLNGARSVAEIKQWMPRFRDTAGLIVDVRDNGGGDRDALLLLYSYLAAPDAPPRVFTAAAYRLHTAHKENHLAQRFMYRAGAREWTESERRAVAAFAKTFKSEWKLPPGQFSDWHYLALSRLDDRDVYHYAKPVVMLMNARCFSATDIFLAGLKGMNNVTLVGTPSGGGSALGMDIVLGATPFRVRLGSMASFQSDGKLFDGHGVQPDVVVEPVPEYHIGGRDNVLAEAVKRIHAR